MLQKLKQWIELSALLGVEIRLGKEGVELINACSLKLKGDFISVLSKKENLKNVNHLAKHFKPAPLAVCITGRGVLTKELKDGSSLDRQVVQQVMPNANEDEFYFQVYPKEGVMMVSLIRRTVADEVLAELNAVGFQVVALSLAEPAEDAAYKAAFQVLLNEGLIEVADERFTQRRRQLFAKIRVIGVAAAFGGAFVLLMVLNFLLSAYFSGKADLLAARRDVSGMETRKFQQIEDEVVQKARFVINTGWTGGYPMAFLTDRLMTTKPKTITLQELTVNPMRVEKVLGAASTATYEVKKIVVSGNCDEAATLNNWLFAIRSEEYVSDCAIGRYELSKESGRGSFTIYISLKDYEG